VRCWRVRRPSGRWARAVSSTPRIETGISSQKRVRWKDRCWLNPGCRGDSPCHPTPRRGDSWRPPIGGLATRSNARSYQASDVRAIIAARGIRELVLTRRSCVGARHDRIRNSLTSRGGRRKPSQARWRGRRGGMAGRRLSHTVARLHRLEGASSWTGHVFR